MTVSEFAHFYVTTIEPIVRVGAFIFAGIFIIWFFMLLKSGEKKGDIINAIVTGTWKGLVAVALFFGLFVQWIFRFFVRIVTVIIASVRDFFTSENL